MLTKSPKASEAISISPAPIVHERDDLDRPVYCICGIPIDAVTLIEAVGKVRAAIETRQRLFVSTPNLNFLSQSQVNPEFRESLLVSDLCVADGAPVVWIAALLGIPLRQRVAGSDLFAKLRKPGLAPRPLHVYFFGGQDGAAHAACQTLNATPGPLAAVGHKYPGFGSVESMSTNEIIRAVNDSGADLLVVALGAAKGQKWLLRNHKYLQCSVVAHLGAVINFVAGTCKRAPKILQRAGLEWLWRIKQEPHLWRRYARDGLFLARLLLTRLIPLALLLRVHAWRRPHTSMNVAAGEQGNSVRLALTGVAGPQTHEPLNAHVRQALRQGKELLVVDLSNVTFISPRFIGQLLMIRKAMRSQSGQLDVIGASAALRRAFRLNGALYLLDDDHTAEDAIIYRPRFRGTATDLQGEELLKPQA